MYLGTVTVVGRSLLHLARTGEERVSLGYLMEHYPASAYSVIQTAQQCLQLPSERGSVLCDLDYFMLVLWAIPCTIPSSRSNLGGT